MQKYCICFYWWYGGESAKSFDIEFILVTRWKCHIRQCGDFGGTILIIFSLLFVKLSHFHVFSILIVYNLTWHIFPTTITIIFFSLLSYTNVWFIIILMLLLVYSPFIFLYSLYGRSSDVFICLKSECIHYINIQASFWLLYCVPVKSPLYTSIVKCTLYYKLFLFYCSFLWQIYSVIILLMNYSSRHQGGDTKYLLLRRRQGFPGGSLNNPPDSAGDRGSVPGLGRSHMPRSN